jgi:hypothetical protein
MRLWIGAPVKFRDRRKPQLRAQLEYGLKETIYDMFRWVREQPNCDLNGLMKDIDHFFLHSEGLEGCM